MIERRSQLRYLPREPLSVTLSVRGQAIQGWLNDISTGGCLLRLPLQGAAVTPPRTDLSGALDLGGGTSLEWQGKITHTEPIRCDHGAGIRFAELRQDLLEPLLARHDTGALRITSHKGSNALSLVGYFGVQMNRSFLNLVRSGSVRQIDLHRCNEVDSAGLGLLKIASEQAIPITGARGKLKTLLEIARIQ